MVDKKFEVTKAVKSEKIKGRLCPPLLLKKGCELVSTELGYDETGTNKTSELARWNFCGVKDPNTP